MTLPEGRSRKDRPSVCLITPAFRRYALSEICLRQHREAIDALDNMGIDAQQVVIADDENLDIAKELGFLTVESPNDWLGKKFNDGHELAAKEGYQYTFPVGSDIIFDPALIPHLLKGFTKHSLQKKSYVGIVYNNTYSMFHPTGTKRMNLQLAWGILQLINVDAMVKRKYRPCDEEIPKGCDTATRKNTIKQRWKLRRAEQLHPYEIVGLQSSENQITDFDHLAEVAESEIEEGSPKDLLNPLRMWYTSETVDALVDFYGNGLSQLSDSCRLFMV